MVFLRQFSQGRYTDVFNQYTAAEGAEVRSDQGEPGIIRKLLRWLLMGIIYVSDQLYTVRH